MPEEMRVETMELCVTACEKYATNNEVCIFCSQSWVKYWGCLFKFLSCVVLMARASVFLFFFFFLAVFHRVLQRWSRSPWIRNLAARGTWSLAKASALRSHTRWRIFFTCSSEEAWPSACGSARSTFSDVLAGLEMNHQLPSRCWLYLFRQVRSGRYQPLRQEPRSARWF